MNRSIDTNALGFVLADVARMMRAEIDRAVTQAGIGLTPGEVRTLHHAARAGKVRQLTLAERMGVEAMTLSGYLDSLEHKGLIVRTPDPRDRRAKLIELTDAADPIFDRVGVITSRLRETAARGLSPDEWRRMMAALMTIRENLCRAREDNSRRTGKP